MLPFSPSHGSNLANVTATTMPRGKNCFDTNDFVRAMTDNDADDGGVEDGVTQLSSPPPPRKALR